LACEIPRKFDIDSLYICPPYLYTVTTLPWEIKKKSFLKGGRFLGHSVVVATVLAVVVAAAAVVARFIQIYQPQYYRTDIACR